MERLKNRHFTISLAKSTLRILGFCSLLFFPIIALSILIFAEALGILEEL